jgi:hypothetical protein
VAVWVVKEPLTPVDGDGATLESLGDAKPWDEGGTCGLSFELSPAPFDGGACR